VTNNHILIGMWITILAAIAGFSLFPLRAPANTSSVDCARSPDPEEKLDGTVIYRGKTDDGHTCYLVIDLKP